MTGVGLQESSRTTLGDLCEFIRGVSFDSGAARTSQALGYLPILRAGNIGDKLQLEKDLIWVPGGLVSPEQRLRVGDIAICMSSGSADVVGKTAKLEQSWAGSVGAFCGIIRPKNPDQSDYLHFWLRSPSFVQWRDTQARGNNIQNLRFSQFASLEIPAPSLHQQKRIAAILNEQMAAVEKARAAAEEQVREADRLEAAYFREAFRGIVPLSVSEAEQSLPPFGWRWYLLEEVAQLESGHTPSRSRPDWWGGDVPWLALPDIRNLDGRIAKETAERTNEQGLANSSARLLPEGTVCLSRTASVGFVTILGRAMATSQDFVNWTCGAKLDPWFLMHLLRASRGYIRSLSSGAVHKTVYMPAVKSFRVCLPEVEEQRRIASYLNSSLSGAEMLKGRIAQTQIQLEQLPHTLLRRAFSGQI